LSFDPQAIFARKTGREIESFLGFILGIGVVAESLPGDGESRMCQGILGLNADGLLEQVAGTQIVELMKLLQTFGVKASGVAILG
jgi:hypothetical protein